MKRNIWDMLAGVVFGLIGFSLILKIFEGINVLLNLHLFVLLCFFGIIMHKIEKLVKNVNEVKMLFCSKT